MKQLTKQEVEAVVEFIEQQNPIKWIEEAIKKVKDAKESKEVKNYKQDQELEKLSIPYFLK